MAEENPQALTETVLEFFRGGKDRVGQAAGS